MFLEAIKNAILTSKQLELKAESFSKLNRHFLKEIDDFSFKVEDTIDFELDFGEKEYSVNCIPSNKNLENDLYYFVVNEALKEVSFPESRKNYVFELGLRNCYEMRFEFLIELKHSYDTEGFDVKKLHKSRIVSIQKSQKNLTRLRYKTFEEVETLGYILEQNPFVLNKLKEDRDYIIDLEKKAKSELFEIIRIIQDPKRISPIKLISPCEDEIDAKLNKRFAEHNSKLENKIHLQILNELLNTNYTSYNQIFTLDIAEIVNSWLNKNCKKELRDLIVSDFYSGGFLRPIDSVDFLNADCEYWFE